MKRFLAFLSRLLAKAAGIVAQLPKEIKQWQEIIGDKRLTAALDYAAKYTHLTDVEKRELARRYLQELASSMIEKRLAPGTLHDLSDSAANLLIELALQQWKLDKKTTL